MTRRTAVLVGVALALAGISWLVVKQLSAEPSERLIDLAVYRAAGRSVLDGRRVYSYRTLDDLLFTYPPFAALASVPLAVLPVRLMQVLWTAGELVCTGLISSYGFRALLQRVGRASGGRWTPVVLGGLTAVMTQLLPFRDEVKFGQVDELLIVLCLLDCLRRDGSPRFGRVGRVPQGVLVGVAAAVKLTPLVFVPYLLLTGRRRAAGIAVAVFVGLQLVTAAVVPHDADDYWTGALFHSGRLRDNANTSNQSLRGMLLRAPIPHPLMVALLLGSAVVALVAGYLAATRASRAGDELTGVAVVGLLAVLLSPVAWIHHLTWLPLVIGAVVVDGRSRRRVALGLLLVVWFVVKLPWIGYHLDTTRWPLWLSDLLQDAYGIAALALVVGAWCFTRSAEVPMGPSGHTGPERPVAVAHPRTVQEPSR